MRCCSNAIRLATSCTLVLSIAAPPLARAEVQPANDGTHTVVTHNGNLFLIQGGTLSANGGNLFHSFACFGLTSQEVASFFATPTIENIVARVVGGDPSFIDGLLEVTGGNPNLFFINPAGIVFGSHARLNVPGDFLATTASSVGFQGEGVLTMGTTRYGPLNGAPARLGFQGSGAIVNAGDLEVGEGRVLALLGTEVISTGDLAAPGGAITIAAVPNSTRVRLSQEGAILGIEIERPDRIHWEGSAPHDLAELLTVGNQVLTTGLEVGTDGSVTVEETGTTLPATAGLAVVSGELDASGVEGGVVDVRGYRVALLGATVDASGTHGGGEVSLDSGFGFRGGTGACTLVDVGSTIRADALEDGDGGQVRLWSDGVTSFRGQVSARGGSESGDGGFVEVSGAASLLFRGGVDVRSPWGEGGTVLLDPADIVIAVDDDTAGSDSEVLDDGQVLGGDGAPDATFTISEAALQQLGVSAHIVLEATNDISFTGPFNSVLNLPMDESGSVTMTADSDGDHVGSLLVGPSIVTQGASVTLAAADMDGSSLEVITNGGAIDIRSGGAIPFGVFLFADSSSATGFGGNINIVAQGDLDMGGRPLNANSSGPLGAGSVHITSLTGSIDMGNVNASSAAGTGGGITLQAAGNILMGDLVSSGEISGGDIRVTSTTGSILANFADEGPPSRSIVSSSDSGQGGSITLSAAGDIGFGAVDSSGTTGGGDIALTASGGSILGYLLEPDLTVTVGSSSLQGAAGDIVITSGGNVDVQGIDASGETAGGDISVTTAGFFRTHASFLDSTGTAASVSSAASSGDGGDIVLRHGGAGVTPFIVGSDPASGGNGTLGSVTSGDATVQSASVLGNLREGNVWIIALDEQTAQTSDLFLTGPAPGSPEVVEPTVRSMEPLALASIEASFTNEYERHFGLPAASIKTLDQVRTELRAVEDATGVRPALIYVFFPAVSDERELAATATLQLLLVTSSGLPVQREVPGATRGPVVETAQRFWEVMSDAHVRPKLDDAEQLYRWLVAPLEDDLEAYGIQQLVFVLPKDLRSIPLAALHEPGGGFLIERYPVSLMPSVSLTDNRHVDLRSLALLAMGAQTFPDKSRLPSVPTEIEILTQDVWKGVTYLDEDFTVSNLQKARSDRALGMIHLATHAAFRPGAPAQSYIEFWNTKLGLDRIRELRLANPPVELMTLSACQTALGDEQAELGFTGLAVQAEVKGALGSLWPVEDRGALAFMVGFYGSLRESVTKAEALRRAQLAMLKGEIRDEKEGIVTPWGTKGPKRSVGTSVDLSQPFYWSGFTLVGNPW